MKDLIRVDILRHVNFNLRAKFLAANLFLISDVRYRWMWLLGYVQRNIKWRFLKYKQSKDKIFNIGLSSMDSGLQNIWIQFYRVYGFSSIEKMDSVLIHLYIIYGFSSIE